MLLRNVILSSTEVAKKKKKFLYKEGAFLKGKRVKNYLAIALYFYIFAWAILRKIYKGLIRQDGVIFLMFALVRLKAGHHILVLKKSIKSLTGNYFLVGQKLERNLITSVILLFPYSSYILILNRLYIITLSKRKWWSS